MGHIENGKWFVAADGRSAGLTEPDPYSQFCLACGYALAELDKNYCPECGSAFDPHDDNTFRNDSPATRKAIERYRRRATASWLLALTFLVSFLYLLTFADSLQPRIGAHGLIVTGHACDLYDPPTLRAATGALFGIATTHIFSQDDLNTWLEQLRQQAPGLQIIGTSGHGETRLSHCPFTAPTLLVIGNEAVGLSRRIRQLCDWVGSIPMSGQIPSLNMASAATVCLYEVQRQRMEIPGVIQATDL